MAFSLPARFGPCTPSHLICLHSTLIRLHARGHRTTLLFYVEDGDAATGRVTNKAESFKYFSRMPQQELGGGRHNIAKLLRLSLLPRLVDAATWLPEDGGPPCPELRLHASWRTQLSEVRLAAEEHLGLTPKQLVGHAGAPRWESDGKQRQHLFLVDPRRSDAAAAEHKAVCDVFTADPVADPATGEPAKFYKGGGYKGEGTWGQSFANGHRRVLSVHRVENDRPENRTFGVFGDVIKGQGFPCTVVPLAARCVKAQPPRQRNLPRVCYHAPTLIQQPAISHLWQAACAMHRLKDTGQEFEGGVHSRWLVHGTQARMHKAPHNIILGLRHTAESLRPTTDCGAPRGRWPSCLQKLNDVVNGTKDAFAPYATERSLWGMGAYFARDAAYSHCLEVKGQPHGACYDAESGTYKVLLCLVITGMTCLGAKDLKLFSQKRGKHDHYDSACDCLSAPEVFVVPEGAAYPAYVIEYK